MSGMEIYLITRMDAFSNFLFWILFFSLVALVAYIFEYNIRCDYDGRDEDKKKEHFNPLKKKLKIYIPIWFIFFFIYFLIPSTKETVVIYVMPKIINNEQVQQLPENFADLLNTKMKEWIEESTTLKKKDKK